MNLRCYTALSSYDILLEIFEWLLLYGDSWPASRRTLAGCVRVCKTFSNPALSILWRRIEGLSVLFKLLEPTLSHLEGMHDEPYCLHGELLPTQFSRFQKYASYVRAVCFGATSVFVDPIVFTYLAHLNRGRPILPALQKFTWFQSIPLTAQLTSIVPKSLRELYLTLDDRHNDMSDKAFTTHTAALLRLLTLELPVLEKLTVSGDSHPSYIFPIVGFCQLRSLDLKEWLYPLIFHQPEELSGLERSSDLIEAAKSNMTPSSRTIPAPARFHMLENLAICTDLERGTLLFAIISTPMLRSLDLTFAVKIRIKQFRRFLDLVCPKLTSCSHITLDVRLSRNRDPQSLMYILTPLLMLKDLRTISVNITTSPKSSLSDQDIIDLAVAWPRAKVIKLDYEYSSPPLLTSLVHFAQHCPDLTRLTLPRMDFSLVSISKRDYPILSHGLIRLDIGGCCPIPDPLAAALFLDCIFPKLDSEPFRRHWLSQVPDGWDVLADTLDALKFARECESVRQAPSNHNSNSSD